MSYSTLDHRFSRLRQRIGDTPTLILRSDSGWLVSHRGIVPFRSPIRIPNGNYIVLKLEHLSLTSPSGSMYDRLYWRLFYDAEMRGLIHPEHTHVLECSVGNAGAAFAYAARSLGYRRYSVILPEDIYTARIEQVRQLGAEVLFSQASVGPRGYIEMMEELLREHRWQRRDHRSRILRMCPISKIRRVPSEPYGDFALEALGALTKLGMRPCFDAFVSVVGAGNTISLVGRYLRNINPRSRIVVAEHQENPFVALLLNGEQPPLHGTWSEPDYPATTIHGIPLAKMNLDLAVVDAVTLLSREERDHGVHVLNDLLGLAAGRTSGTAFEAAIRMCEVSERRTILVPVFDSKNKYADAWLPIRDYNPIDYSLRRTRHVA